MKAIFSKASGYANEVYEELVKKINENDVRYWSNDFDEIEIRIDLCNLDENQLLYLREEFGVDTRKFDYLILWF